MYTGMVPTSFHNKRENSMPKPKGKVSQPRPLILQKNSSSPQRSSVGMSKEMYSNNNIGYKPVPRVSKHDGVNSGVNKSYTNGVNKAHRSPVPLIKASPLTGKDKSFVGQKVMSNNNNSLLSASHLTKLKSAGVEIYGGSAVHSKNTLQKYHLEK